MTGHIKNPKEGAYVTPGDVTGPKPNTGAKHAEFLSSDPPKKYGGFQFTSDKAVLLGEKKKPVFASLGGGSSQQRNPHHDRVQMHKQKKQF